MCVCAGGKISRLAGIHLEDIPCVIACVEWLGTAYSMLSVACDLAVNFEVYTLSNSDNVCDECCVLAYIRTRISDD